VSSALLRHIVDSSGRPIGDCSAIQTRCIPTDEHHEDVIQLIVESTDAGRDVWKYIDFPIKRFPDSCKNACWSSSEVQLPISSFRQNFPQDFYRLHVNTGLSLPAGTNWDTKPAGLNIPLFQDSWPIGQDYNVHATSTSSTATFTPGDYAETNLDFTIDRGPLNIAFVYLVASIPFIFCFLFAHVFFGANRRDKDRAIGWEGFVVALVAATLAVLPVRAVLVPSDIGEVTRADDLLVLGVISLVGLGVCKYVWELWRQERIA
jgi:hypothetical protein